MSDKWEHAIFIPKRCDMISVLIVKKPLFLKKKMEYLASGWYLVFDFINNVVRQIFLFKHVKYQKIFWCLIRFCLISGWLALKMQCFSGQNIKASEDHWFMIFYPKPKSFFSFLA